MEELLKYKIAVNLIPGIGDIIAKKLIAYCGGVEGVFKEKKNTLIKIPGVGQTIAASIVSADVFNRAEEEVKFVEKNSIKPLFYLDDGYPNRLKHCSDSPVMLYYKGTADLNNSYVLAVVGTRRCTEYGKKVCRQIIHDLKHHNILIVSGLAYGIDYCAHKSALEFDLPTVGVVAHGLDMLYPSAHKSMAEKMIINGGLLTEFMSKTNPDKENFPKRNRIVAGMVDAVLVAETAERGGALITAEIANSYNRDVFAVPGRIDDAISKGCNYLIRTNKAALVESAANIEYLMGWEIKKKMAGRQQKLFVELSGEEKCLFDLLNTHNTLPIDELTYQSNLPMSIVAATLLGLEFQGLVKCMPGKIYQIV